MKCFRLTRPSVDFDTHVRERPDVPRHFEELNLNLDYSGFMALVPVRKIADGGHTIGIHIAKADMQAPGYTDRSVRKSGDIVATN